MSGFVFLYLIPNFALGKIYKLTSDQTDRVYIWSTCKTYLSQRKRDHKSTHNGWMIGEV